MTDPTKTIRKLLDSLETGKPVTGLMLIEAQEQCDKIDAKMKDYRKEATTLRFHEIESLL